jgi:dinuclear metal center YbgI/SA1388 family protein
MPNASLAAIVKYCDRRLRLAQIKDFDGAVNGLQVENRGRVSRIAATVDASLATVKLAIAARADLLIVHHGLFWSPSHPWTGKRRELLGLLIEHNLAVYSSHLPLDFHPQLGNNALLCGLLGLKPLQPFLLEKGQHLGVRAVKEIPRAKLARQFGKIIGRAPIILPGGPAVCRKIGVVTGGAGNLLRQAAAEGVDTYISGEGSHWTHALAEELEVNVLYGGHYATETFGVKALAAELSRKFKVPWLFLDHPSGL